MPRKRPFNTSGGAAGTASTAPVSERTPMIPDAREGSERPPRQPQRPALSAIGDAFRAAHAVKPDGTPGEWPSCATCYDGKDVRLEYKQPEFHQDVRAYRCKACRCYFSDLTGTPIERTQAPLVTWAWLLLMPQGDDSLVGRRHRHTEKNKRFREMQRRIQGHPFGQRWKAEMEKAGVTFEQLAAAQATAPKKLAKRAVGSRPKKRATA